MAVAGSVGSTLEAVTHFTAIRMRIYGTGSVKLKLLSLDEVNTQTLVPLPIISANNREQTRLCNFNEQRAQLELKTTEINEKVTVTRIIIYARQLFTDYPA